MKVFEKLNEIQKEAVKAIKDLNSMNDLNDLKVKYLGKKGYIADVMKMMKDLSNEDRPKLGKVSNEVKEAISEEIQKQQLKIQEALVSIKLASESIDVSLPGKSLAVGRKHIITQVIEELEDLFIGMGYEVREGPEIETDEINFEKLNVPKNHPARDMQDTFYVTDERLMRTQTSPVQIRTMMEYGGKQPIKMICHGKVYRRDDDDATHSHQFMQLEALVVDTNTSMSDLKGTLLKVAQAMFGDERDIRLRPSYFPFTEPSMEIDVSCSKCNGKGCAMCKGTGWIEILGAGLVNNNVLEAGGYDSKVYQGFALGIGIERIAMLKYGIHDIRDFYINDIRFNKQFV